jgi:cell wall-associated NlpC family hydrolase
LEITPQRISAIHALVGIPWVKGGTDPAIGFDCVTCAAEVYRLIGEAIGDPDGWRFPLPERWTDDTIPLRALLEWHRFWEPCTKQFGAGVVLIDGHFGILIDSGWVIHARRRSGVVLQRATRLLPAITGYFRLRPGGPGPVDPKAIPVLRAIRAGHTEEPR